MRGRVRIVIIERTGSGIYSLRGPGLNRVMKQESIENQSAQALEPVAGSGNILTVVGQTCA